MHTTNTIAMSRPPQTTVNADRPTITLDAELFHLMAKLIADLVEPRPQEFDLGRDDLLHIIGRLSIVLSSLIEKERP
jgi:hypothetical protein